LSLNNQITDTKERTTGECNS